jgi:predicted RNA-binding protein with PIN domain
MVCAVTGLEHTYAGQGLGAEAEAEAAMLEPVLSYRIEVPEGCDLHRTFLQLRQLEEEEPQLHIVWEEQSGEIHAQLMGEVQIEILRTIIQERFGIRVEFGTGSIVYKETIRNTVEGMGHFEPLRHYAEVHLLMEPGARGSGLVFDTDCSEDMLDRNWQRLILTHLEEKQHKGVLTGSELTDVKITLVAGRAHQKHTEGGDFRQATYRAVRHGLMCAENILLEPVYEFRLEVPSEAVGRAMTDIQKMYGSFGQPMIEADMALLEGQAPVVTMQGYQSELLSYTKGRGRLSCTLKGYEECHNPEEVIAQRGYDCELDTENPSGSVFCSHGAGYVVPWELVHEFMHVDSGLGLQMQLDYPEPEPEPIRYNGSFATGPVDENELKAIFERTYGAPSQERRSYTKSRRVDTPSTGRTRPRESLEEYLLVDGYNIIFAWEELSELAKTNIDAARDKLMDIMSNYQGYKKNHLILVFDAYKVAGGRGEIFRYHNIHVVYTKEAETADQYIEKTVHAIGRKYHVTVATSDALEQIIIMGGGADRMSARDLYAEVEQMQQELRATYLSQPTKGARNYLFDHVDETLGTLLEEVRLGKKNFDTQTLNDKDTR